MTDRMGLSDIADLAFNRPVMITRQKAEIILGVIGPRLNIASLQVAGEARQSITDLSALAAAERVRLEQMPGDAGLARRDWNTGAVLDPYETWNGVAILYARGTLAPEVGLNPSSGMTGYDGLSYKLRYADGDPKVKGIALDINSPGGSCNDLFELTSLVRDVGSRKPIRAIVRGQACSAAYALASCCQSITTGDLGIVGSIGALMMHADFSKSLEQEGIAVTLIASAEHKTDGSPYEPLPVEFASWLQTQVDGAADNFKALVADTRGISVDELTAQQARIYSASEGLGLRLVDQVMPWGVSLREFAQAVNGGSSRSAAGAPLGAGPAKEKAMDPKATAPAAEVQPDTAAIDAARSEGNAAGLTAGATAERERILGIVDVDAKSVLSDGAKAAIEAGTSVGAHATEIAKAAKNAGPAALNAARTDAIGAGEIAPADAKAAAGGAERQTVNRGQAYAERKHAKA